MKYFKAKYLKNGQPSGAAYTYKSDDDIQIGDTVVNSKGSKLLVTEEADMEWVKTYGENKVGVAKKLVEEKEND